MIAFFSMRLGVLKAGDTYRMFLIWILLAFGISSGGQTLKDKIFENVQWGGVTNGLKMGVILNHLTNNGREIVELKTVLICANSPVDTNTALKPLGVFLPPFENRYRLRLTDSNGNLVEETEKGAVMGRPITQPLKVNIGGLNISAVYRGRFLNPGTPDLLPDDSLRVEDYFKISNPGKYFLKMQIAAIIPTQKTGTNAVFLPPVNIGFEIANPN